MRHQIEETVLLRVPWIGRIQIVGLIHFHNPDSVLPGPDLIRFTNDNRNEIPSRFSGYGLLCERHLGCRGVTPRPSFGMKLLF